LLALLLLLHSADAASTTERLAEIQSAWRATDAYCGSFILALYGQANAAISTGSTCWSRADRIRTETDSPLGPVIEIRGDREVWYHNPARPVVLHFKASADLDTPSTREVGEGIGELVALLVAAPSLEALPDTDIAGRPTWAFQTPRGRDEAVIFVDAARRLPVALELRRDDKPVMSYGLAELEVNLPLPESVFTIEAPEGYPVVDMVFDPNVETPSEAAGRAPLE